MKKWLIGGAIGLTTIGAILLRIRQMRKRNQQRMESTMDNLMIMKEDPQFVREIMEVAAEMQRQEMEQKMIQQEIEELTNEINQLMADMGFTEMIARIDAI